MSRRRTSSPSSYSTAHISISPDAEAVEKPNPPVTASAEQTPPPPSKPPSGGSRVWAWLLGLGVLGGAAVLGVFAAWWLYFNIIITIDIQDQAVGVYLPESFDAVATVTNSLDVAMKGQIQTEVPFKQDLIVPFKGRYDFDVEMNAKVPVKFEVVYDGVLPVDTSADVTIRTSINYKNLKSLRNLEIKTALPLKFPLPVKLKIPVEDVIDLSYVGPLSADINQDVKTRVDTVLRTRLPINQTITTPVTAALPLKVYPDNRQVRLILTEMKVNLQPATMLEFSVAENLDEPKRVENRWGPLDQPSNLPSSPRVK